MHDMTQQLTLTTQLYLVFQEGNIKHCCYSFMICWYSTHRIVSCVILSRKEHAVAQTRELEARKIVVRSKDMQVIHSQLPHLYLLQP